MTGHMRTKIVIHILARYESVDQLCRGFLIPLLIGFRVIAVATDDCLPRASVALPPMLQWLSTAARFVERTQFERDRSVSILGHMSSKCVEICETILHPNASCAANATILRGRGHTKVVGTVRWQFPTTDGQDACLANETRKWYASFNTVIYHVYCANLENAAQC